MSDHFQDQGRPHSLFGHLEAADPEIAARIADRASAVAAGASTSRAVAAGLALASAPIALAVLASDAFGQTTRLPAVVISVLNFALTLERLESAFYTMGTSSMGPPIPAGDLPIFTTITKHEADHVQALTSALGSSARSAPTFDFTANGMYPDVFTNYDTFKALAQAFEDTGVRAYKGQAPSLMPYKNYLAVALSIHSVEARHASEIRRLRGGFTETGPNGKGWITGASTDIPGGSATYAGEDNTSQGGVDVTTLYPAPSTAYSEAFDEPLTMQQVLAIAGNFIRS